MKITEPVLSAPAWAELGTSDPEGAAAFYGRVLGWRAETDPRPEAGGYTRLLLDDDPVAGLVPHQAAGQPVAWTFSVAVADADGTAGEVPKAGGTVLLDPTDVLDLGRYAVIADPGGAVLTLWEARTFRGAARLNEPGALCWVELATRDTAAAEAFYGSVFGWSAEGGPYVHWGVGGRNFGGMVRMDERYPEGAPPHWTLYFAVLNVDAAVNTATEAGGSVGYPAMDIPGTGRVAGLYDPQGGAFAVYTPEGVARTEP
ncbi:VOC family protein [Streptomyces pathocidini]|uniref:VOC family protein n=1 Tax=Streptomyces pathocidini TaxID=1650571 RepID=A0ABW7UNI1_9ACTN|nr:VOC family protein [Streptomyces pathocidini]